MSEKPRNQKQYEKLGAVQFWSTFTTPIILLLCSITWVILEGPIHHIRALTLQAHKRGYTTPSQVDLDFYVTMRNLIGYTTTSIVILFCFSLWFCIFAVMLRKERPNTDDLQHSLS